MNRLGVKLAMYSEPLLDDMSPEVVFARIRGDYGFVFRTGQGDRYSFVGYDPAFVLRSEKSVLHLEQLKSTSLLPKGPRNRLLDGDSFDAFRDVVKGYAFTSKPPVPFFGGFAGLMSYDYGCSFVGVEQKVFDDYQLPDFVFAFYDKVVCFDHEEKKVWYLALGVTDMEAERVLESLKSDMKKMPVLRGIGAAGNFVPSLDEKQYGEKIEQVQKLLKSGDTYQVNFSHRFVAEGNIDPWRVFLKLEKITPAPFGTYFEFPDFQVVSCSPELLVRKRGKFVETWPIKGTVRRGKNSSEDEKLVSELLRSQKNEAELNMIVDLERNDLGKVCEVGSVNVVAHREIQKYSHVIHTVSKVQGLLRSDSDVFDLVRAIFPGGSITGCPKKRTMEIIDQIEDFRRGVYTGSAGYIGLNGDMDLNILIRTFLFKGQKIYVHAGGGIVFDSNFGDEYKESLQKMASLEEALKQTIS